MTDFAKYQALGNDYLVVDSDRLGLLPGPDLARELCDRHRGIGADGVLFGPANPVPAGGTVAVTTYNSDGSCCDRSVNGVRMFALHLVDQGLVDRTPTSPELVIRTPAGDSPVRIIDADRGLVSVRLDPPSFDAADIGVLGWSGSMADWQLAVDNEQWRLSCLYNGNPHAVVFLDELSEARTRELGPQFAGHPRFPQRINVAFARVVDRNTLDLQIYERGAGYTLASGSSSCAAASAARRLGWVADQVTVRMPGGEVEVSIDDRHRVSLTGPVEKVASGEFADQLRRRLGLAPAERVPA
ncbi:MAG: diaminopimelate epimerase [Jatrophihabitantaceae bacterium]